jgi:hypothetical protein
MTPAGLAALSGSWPSSPWRDVPFPGTRSFPKVPGWHTAELIVPDDDRKNQDTLVISETKAASVPHVGSAPFGIAAQFR